MEYQRAYAAIKTIQSMIQACDEEIKKTDGDVKDAFIVIKAYYEKRLAFMNADLAAIINLLVEKRNAQNNISGNEYNDGKGRARSWTSCDA